MTNRSLVVGVDVDEVCADLLGAALHRYNAEWDDSLTVDDIDGWDLTPQTKAGSDFYHRYFGADTYDAVLPIWGARNTVDAIRAAGHRVVFVTATHPANAHAKFLWLRRYGFLPHATDEDALRDYFPVRDKALVGADVLFDDAEHNVRAFPRQAYLVAHPHNRKSPLYRVPFGNQAVVLGLLARLTSTDPWHASTLSA